MTRLLINLLFLLGLLLAAFGVAVDYIMPGATPGLNLPQMLTITIGVALAISACLLRRAEFLRRLRGSLRKHGLKALAITLLTLITLEIALTIVGYPTYYPIHYSEEPLDLVPWWTCDERGCRYVYDATVDACAKGSLQGRACIVNRQGFGDNDDFTVESLSDARTRILFLGDSFTRGYGADVGSSYVETVEKQVQEALIWNAGIGGTGTNQAATTFADLGPLLQPQVTILGFYTNDFKDNLYPFDAKIRFVREDGKINVIRTAYFDQDSKLVRQAPTVSYVEYAIAGRLPIPGGFARRLGNTRLGSLLLESIKRLQTLSSAPDPDPHFRRSIALTRGYLSALRQQAEAQDSAFLVLMIDSRKDMDQPKMRYETAIDLFHELEIPYLDTKTIMQLPEDYMPVPDVHWNNAGHQKVGMILSNCIQALIGGGELADCEHVTMPSGEG
jgi:hypothetical protein